MARLRLGVWRAGFVAAAAAGALLAAPAAWAQDKDQGPVERHETLTDESVVQLAHAGLGAGALVGKIRASHSRFDVSSQALVALKGAEVPDAVIGAMLEASARGGAPASMAELGGDEGPGASGRSGDPRTPHAGGIYLLEGESGSPWMQQLDPTVATDTHNSSIMAWFFSSGLVPLKVTTVLAGSAHFKADTTRPIFYFYFNQPGSGLFQSGLGNLRLPGPEPTPALFALVHFSSVNGERELLTSVVGPALGPQSKEPEKAEVPCTFDQVGPGVYQLRPDAPLAPGEYAFSYTPDSDGDDDSPPTRYFDFSVPG